MAGEPKNAEDHPIASEKEALSKKLDAIGWAVFLIWVGFASLLDFGWAFSRLMGHRCPWRHANSRARGRDRRLRSRFHNVWAGPAHVDAPPHGA